MHPTFHLSIHPSFGRTSPSQLFEETWYQLGRKSAESLSQILFNPDIVYHAPIPSGAKLLCANHPTTIDPVMLTTLVPEQVHILISETLFKVPALGPSLAASGHIRVVHSNGRPALEEGLRCLSSGRTVGIFPEGAISAPDGTLARLHTGAARMALASGAPVIPVGIALQQANVLRVKTVVDGRVEVGTWYFHGPYALTVGEPVVFTGDANDKEQVRAVTQQIAEHITALSHESQQRLNLVSQAPFKPSLVNLYEIAEPFFKWMRLVFVRSKNMVSLEKG